MGSELLVLFMIYRGDSVESASFLCVKTIPNRPGVHQKAPGLCPQQDDNDTPILTLEFSK
jgi:hypothetical protein